MPPGMGMGGASTRPQWQPNTSTPMNYSSSSPGNYGVSTIKRRKSIVTTNSITNGYIHSAGTAWIWATWARDAYNAVTSR